MYSLEANWSHQEGEERRVAEEEVLAIAQREYVLCSCLSYKNRENYTVANRDCGHNYHVKLVAYD